MSTQSRTLNDRKRQYDLERALADRLRKADRAKRLTLYGQLYDKLYREFPHLKTDPKTFDPNHVKATLRLLKPFLGQDKTFLEIGAGNLAISREVAKRTDRVIALDVSKEFAHALGPIPSNVELVLTDGVSVPILANSIDIAYSSQLMEHLHPDDAQEQLKGIYRALKPGGIYICNTPHRFNGPHDISAFFDREATGFHLKEYTNKELSVLFKKTGFHKIYSLTGAKGYVLSLPLWPIIGLEKLLVSLPSSLRRNVARFPPVKVLLGIRLAGKKVDV